MNTFFDNCGGTDWLAEITFDFTKTRLNVENHIFNQPEKVPCASAHTLTLFLSCRSQLSEAPHRFIDELFHARRFLWQHHFFCCIIASSGQSNPAYPRQANSLFVSRLN
jgi:hypothetical protein